MEIHQKDIDAQLSKVEDDGKEKYRPGTRELRHGQWLRVAGDQVVLKEEKVFAVSGKQKGQCSRGDRCSSRHDGYERAKPTPKTAPPSEPPTPRGRSASTERSFRGRSPSAKTNPQPCKNFLKGTCTKLPCDSWHPPEC